MQKERDRSYYIRRAGNIGTGTNLVLGGLKITAGVFTHSIAILSDGVNNLSDSISSIVTLIGYRLSKRRPTKAHPMGYGRIEYLSALLVSILVILTGFSFLRSSIAKVGSPSSVSVTPIVIVIMILSVIVKIALWVFYNREGKRTESTALGASALDSVSDALVTAVTLISTLLSPILPFSLDAPAGIVVSLFIMWTGVSSVLTISDTILGKRPSKENVQRIRNIIRRYPPLRGGYDIRIHSYGPESSVGTIDVEVPFEATAEEVYEAMEKAKKELLKETGTIFTFGMNAENQDDARVKEMMDKTLKCIQMSSEYVIGIHGFHVHFEEKRIEFDVVVSFALRDWEKFRRNLTGLLEMIFPDYTVSFNIDPDYS